MEHAAYLFGAVLRDLRHSPPTQKLRVPTICQHIQCARSRWYRWEHGEETPMKDNTLKSITRFFNIQEYTNTWYEIINYTYLAHNSIPPYLRQHNVNLWHIVFVKLHTVNPTVKEFSAAMDFIQENRS